MYLTYEVFRVRASLRLLQTTRLNGSLPTGEEKGGPRKLAVTELVSKIFLYAHTICVVQDHAHVGPQICYCSGFKALVKIK